MKKILGYLLTTVFLVTVVATTLTACGKKAEYTRVTVDINPSVELIVDNNDKVVSVTALNDDASALIVGETFVGLSAREAAKLVVSLAVDTGFLTSGTVEMGDNTVSISVSGGKSQSKKTYEKILESVYNFLKEKNVDAYIERVEAWKTKELKTAVAENSAFCEEEVEKMSESQLYAALAASRIETAELLSAEMRKAYFAAKEHQVSLAKHNATAKVIEAADGFLSVAHEAYLMAINGYSKAVTALDNMRYSLLVEPSSSYQTALSNLRDKKDALIAAQTHAASFTGESAQKAEADYAVIAAGYAYESALNLLTTLGETANDSLVSLVETLRSAEETFAAVEATFPDSLKEQITAKAEEIDREVNAAKDGFFAKFESAHASDVAAFRSAMQARKEALIAAAKGE